MKIILLGTGTSHGIPCIACECRVCKSTDERDKRLRCSAYVTNKNKDGSVSHILVDIGPEFRIQAIKYGIKAVDAVLLTHSHADHLHGLDDIRVFSHTYGSDRLAELQKNPENAGVDPKLLEEAAGNGIAIYSNPQTLKDVHNRFDYIFKENTQIGGGKPKLHLVDCNGLCKKDTDGKTDGMNCKMPKEFGDMTVTPIPMKHGRLDSTGWLFSVSRNDGKIHSVAYLTDCSHIPVESVELLKQKGGIIEHCIIDGLRVKPHSTHFGFRQAMDIAEQIKPQHTWFIHICHLMTHVEIQQYAMEQLALHDGDGVCDYPNLAGIVRAGGSVGPAYDGMSLEI